MRGRDRVFVDANELSPFSVMDLVLTLAEELVIDFVWTDELLTEWERVIVREAQADAGHGTVGIAGAAVLLFDKDTPPPTAATLTRCPVVTPTPSGLSLNDAEFVGNYRPRGI